MVKDKVLHSSNRVILYRILNHCLAEGYDAKAIYNFFKYYFIEEGRDYKTVKETDAVPSTSNRNSLQYRYQDMQKYLKMYMRKVERVAKTTRKGKVIATF